ncbi:MAG: hypothetical protein R3359_11000 [Marinirhabdus sp.]|nr:hypothetical protein [Marinirhabdus sp.]
MLVLNDIAFNLDQGEQPVVQRIYNYGGKQLLAIGLAKGVAFEQSYVATKAKIMVVQGEIDVNTASHSYRLERFDSFELPREPFTIIGVFDAVFLLMVHKVTKEAH